MEVTEAEAIAEYESVLDIEAAAWVNAVLFSVNAYDGKSYAQQQYPIAYEQIGKALDALETKAKADLAAELRRVRSDLAARLKTAKTPKSLTKLPRRKELEIAVLGMLDRAQAAGQRAMRDEVPRAYDASFTPRAAVKWLRDAAFWVMDILSDDLLSAAQGILVRGLKNGTATSTMMAELFEAFVPFLGGAAGPETITAHRLETIVRTNTTTAYNHGRLTALLDPDLVRFTKGAQYSAILDTRTTEVCRFLHGKVFLLPAGVKVMGGGTDQTKALEELLPPRHHQCRSIILPVMAGTPISPDEIITPDQIARAKELSGAGFMQRGAFRNYGDSLLAARVALLKAQVAMHTWDEGKHPRVPKGSGDDSGEFAPKDSISTEVRKLFGEWGASLSEEDVVYGFRAAADGDQNIGPMAASEGIGPYIARDFDTAAFFGEPKQTAFKMPKNPMVVREEPLHILQETSEIMERPKKTDSPWLSANKEAVRVSKTTDTNWGEKTRGELQRALTDVLLKRGYDSVYVSSGKEDWIVLLKSK